MKTTAVGSAHQSEPAVLKAEDRQYTFETPPAQFAEDAEKVFDFLRLNIPGGTLNRVMVLLLESEKHYYAYQFEECHDREAERKAKKFAAVANIYKQRS